MPTDSRYTPAVGRRKTASATVRLTKAATVRVTVNGKSAQEYFKTATLIAISGEALHTPEIPETLAAEIHVSGGGLAAQADAVRHAISRALAIRHPILRAALKKAHFLTRDPRAKERKKPGLKKARKAPQWAKR